MCNSKERLRFEKMSFNGGMELPLWSSNAGPRGEEQGHEGVPDGRARVADNAGGYEFGTPETKQLPFDRSVCEGTFGRC